MISKNFKQRISALLIDYICIIIYLLILFALTMCVYYIFFKNIPEFTEAASQWISFITTVLPVTLYYTIKESKKPFASFGKKKTGLMVHHSNKAITGSLIRNVLKFLPWQLGHVAVIKGIYNGFESLDVIILYGLAIILPIIFMGMVMLRTDHRHIPDILAQSFVVDIKSERSV